MVPLPGVKFRTCIRLQEAARRTAEGPHWDVPLIRGNRAQPERLLRRPFDPATDANKPSAPTPIDDEPLNHLAAALWAVCLLSTHV